MDKQLLVDAIVRQTTILIAQLATAGGSRSPLARISNQVFKDLTSELERQGLSRRVAADMFGITLRSYQRKVQRLRESSTDRGRSLWEAIYECLEQRTVATRRELLERFHRDEPMSVRGILKDLVDSGLVFHSGTEPEDVYRIAAVDELGSIRNGDRKQGLEEFVLIVVIRESPIRADRLASLVNLPDDVLRGVVESLCGSERIRSEEHEDGIYYVADKLVIPLDSPAGWEASVYDHFQAVVKTICNRIDRDAADESTARFKDLTGGATYTFNVGPDHPLEGEVLNILSEFRRRCSDLRRRVAAHNEEHGHSEPNENVVVYAGQCVIPQEDEVADGTPERAAGGK